MLKNRCNFCTSSFFVILRTGGVWAVRPLLKANRIWEYKSEQIYNMYIQDKQLSAENEKRG